MLQPITTYKNYAWSILESCSSIIVSAAGLFWLTVTDANDRTGRDSIVINLKDGCLIGFYILTAYTPDGNVRNDNYKPFIGGYRF